MAQKHKVDVHPKRKQIDNAIIKGRPYREIASQYGLTQASIGRYVEGKLRPKIAKAIAERKLKEGSDLLDKLESYLDVAEKMLRACEEYLQDPLDANKLYLGPDASELDVTYTELEAGEDGEERRVKRRESLQRVIERMQNNAYEGIEIKSRTADPRNLILQSATVLTKQIETFGRIHGDIKDVQINLSIQPAFQMLVQTVIDATSDQPMIRREIVNAVKSIQPFD